MAASVFEFLTCTQMLIDASAHQCNCNTTRESALEVDSRGRNPLPHRGLEPGSVLHLAFQSNTLPAQLLGTTAKRYAVLRGFIAWKG